MKIFFNTLGCSKNAVDSENAAALLEENGHVIVDSPEEAGAIIVNTCGFINDAKEESIDTILEMAEYREKGTVLIAAGCLTQRYARDLYEEIPEIDILLGVNEYLRLPEILKEYQEQKKRVSVIGSAAKDYCEIPVRRPEPGAYYSYLKISEGCEDVYKRQVLYRDVFD